MSQHMFLTEQRSKELRNDLKEWEKDFAAANHGRKASRDDIKANGEIAAKYKEYNRLRDIASGKVQPTSPNANRKRNTIDQLDAHTPSKRRSTPQGTPLKRRNSASEGKENKATSIPPTPSFKLSMVGPTPQKDGKVLGIFDVFASATPSKSRLALVNLEPNVLQTPSKHNRITSSLESKAHARGSRTPASSSKRYMLDQFATPRKTASKEPLTPSSMKAFATPAFLRRHTFPQAAVEEDAPSPEPRQPWKRRSFGRSLSSMIEEMRKQEEHEHDDDLDALRELESGVPASRKVDAQLHFSENVQVLDSQLAVELDQDGFVPSDIENEAASDRENDNGVPRKVWKKKGLKRQTRRVIMRPTAKKVANTSEPQNASEDEVEETQRRDGPGDDSAYEDDGTKTQSKDQRKAGGKESTEAAQKPKRKVSATAHANYRALKIKNKNSKGNGRGRFGRRR